MDTALPKTEDRGKSQLEDYIIYSVEQAFLHMTKSRSAAEQRLYVVTDEVLFNTWDALCLSMTQEYRDEYLPYLPHVFDLLKTTKNGQNVFNYLVFIEEKVIGTFPGDILPAKRAAYTINILLKYRDKILKTDRKS